jgi:hypothetical protein
VSKHPDPAIRDYLAAVERQTAGLPAAQRRELLADLREHIDVGLAERPGEAGLILAELGDPREIAGTAFQQDAVRAGLRRRGNPLTPVLLWTLAVVASLALRVAGAPHDALAGPLVLVIAALVTLVRSPAWTTRQKWAAVSVSLAAPYVIATLAHGVLSDHRGAAAVTVDIVLTALRLGGFGWLWTRRGTLAAEAAGPVTGPLATLSPRKRRVVLGAAALASVVAVAVVAVGVAVYLSLDSHLATAGR